jgi:predicted nucleotidyltransferase
VRAGLSEHAGRRCACKQLEERPEQSPLERFCALLAEHGVGFIVIGGQAEALMGSARVTYDVDFCYRRTPDNLERLATALSTLALTLRGAPSDLKFRLDAQALALGQNYTFEVDGEYPLDFFGYLEPIGTYEDLLPHAETVFIGGRPTQVIGLDDLIRIRRHVSKTRLAHALRRHL